MPRVSVVVPTFNRAHLINESIRSVLKQTYTDYEIIIVDDGSTDDTKEVVDGFPDNRIRYIYQDNHGASAARNTGIKAASGEYIAFLDSDDLWLTEYLQLMVRRLDENPVIALVCSDISVFDDKNDTIIGSAWHKKGSDNSVNPQKAARQPLRYLLRKGCFIGPQSALMRRHVFDAVGCFDESLKTHEDWDLFVRIVKRFPIETVDMPLVRVRRHAGDRLQSSRERMYCGASLVLNKAFNNYALSGAELGLVRRRLARTHYRYGRDMVSGGSVESGREKLLASVRVYPWSIWPYLFLAGSFIGRRIILAVKSWKKQLKHRPVRHRTSDGAQSVNG